MALLGKLRGPRKSDDPNRPTLGERAAAFADDRRESMSEAAVGVLDRHIRKDPEKLTDLELTELLDATVLLDCRGMRRFWSELSDAAVLDEVRKHVLSTDRTIERALEIAESDAAIVAEIADLAAAHDAAIDSMNIAAKKVAAAKAALQSRNAALEQRRSLVRSHEEHQRRFPMLPIRDIV